jgi:N-acetylglucosamine kinase-like BadF-type ATPase
LIRRLVIDGGQSGCRAAYLEGSQVLATATAAGLRRDARSDPRLYLQVLRHAVARLDPRPTAVAVVAAGLTGFDGSAEAARAVADAVATLVSAERVLVTSDAVTSYLGAIGTRPGVVVAAGTGAIALAADGDGRVARSDGWGYLLGDDGGAFAIGRRGLRSALRDHDGRGGSTALRQRAEARFGSLHAITRRVYDGGDPVAAVAAFATEVAEAARAGDAEAASVWGRAARELAAAVAAAAAQIFPAGAPVMVSWTGSVFSAHDLLAGPFARHVAEQLPQARLLAPHGTALDGAALLAQVHPCPMFSSLVRICDA